MGALVDSGKDRFMRSRLLPYFIYWSEKNGTAASFDMLLLP